MRFLAKPSPEWESPIQNNQLILQLFDLFAKTPIEMPAPLVACLLQSISLNELLNQIRFPHKIEIALFTKNLCKQLLNSHQATDGR